MIGVRFTFEKVISGANWKKPWKNILKTQSSKFHFSYANASIQQLCIQSSLLLCIRHTCLPNRNYNCSNWTTAQKVVWNNIFIKRFLQRELSRLNCLYAKQILVTIDLQNFAHNLRIRDHPKPGSQLQQHKVWH